MPERALPPVLVLTSDGQPTDDFEAGLKALMSQPWGRKSVRIAIAIGKDADTKVLKRFLGNEELEPLQSNNADALVRHVRWASTAVLKAASAPTSQFTKPGNAGANIPIPRRPYLTMPRRRSGRVVQTTHMHLEFPMMILTEVSGVRSLTVHKWRRADDHGGALWPSACVDQS